ncbi:MAG: DUF2188 domain-containing protein [Brevundimonas sp.]|nr:DUF2188 domain-containing protein [Brevundimonas sp.]MCA3718711.1 DUF2188 domain-containing protein [Brevundimonas sp.]
MAKNQHVVPNRGGWSVKSAGSSRAAKTFTTQRDAIAHAREVAKRQGSELYIHGTDGRIRDRDSYGNDRFPPKG